MSEGIMGRRWLEWNILGKGKPRSFIDSDRFNYDGPVLFSYKYPTARLILASDQLTWVCLTRGYFYPRHARSDLGRKISHLQVPCVGVFSEYASDCNTPEEHHERIRWLLQMKAQDVIDQAQTWPADKLLDSVDSWRHRGQNSLRGQLKDASKEYYTYAKTFYLKWPDFPDRYATELNEVIEKRSKAYFSEKEVTRRERNRAIREGKKAFGV